jgi:hypothetical protein
MAKRPVWIGLAEVAPLPDYHPYQGEAGAFVQVVARAESSDDYQQRAEDAIREVGFHVTEWDDVFPLGPDWPPADAAPALVDAVRDAIRDDAVGWGNWHRFSRGRR